MTNLIALPPSGRGVYARAQSADWLAQWGLVAVAGMRSDAERTVRILKERGVKTWIYSGPESWEPQNWRTTLANLRAKAERWGVGLIADPETGWPALQARARQAEARQLGIALKELSRSIRVGMTSYPLWPGLGGFAEGAAGEVWGSPQVYLNWPESELVGYYNRWVQTFGASKVIPSVAAYSPGGWRGELSAATYRAYLAMIPEAVGALGWTTGTGPTWLLNEYRGWQPSSLPTRAALEVRGILLDTWPGRIALIAIAAVILIAVVAYLWR